MLTNPAPKNSISISWQSQKGLSLIELIIAISITAILSVIIGQMLVSGVDAYSFVMDRKEDMQENRLAMMRIKRRFGKSPAKILLL